MYMKKNAKIYFVLFFVVMSIFVFGTLCANAADAIVDYAKVFAAYPKYAEAAQTYKALTDVKNAELQSKLAALPSQPEKDALVQQYKNFYQQKQNEIFMPVQNNIRNAAISVAREKGLAMVYSKQSGKSGIDITQAIIDRLNQGESRAKAVWPVQQAVSKNEPQKTEIKQTQTSTPVSDSRKNIEVQFGADYNKAAIASIVEKARKNGLKDAYVCSATKNGKALWRARVPVANEQEAAKVSDRLSKIGFKNFIAK